MYRKCINTVYLQIVLYYSVIAQSTLQHVFSNIFYTFLYTGIPGIQGVPLRPDMGRDYLKRRSDAAIRVWNHARPEKPDYNADLPTARIQLKKKTRTPRKK